VKSRLKMVTFRHFTINGPLDSNFCEVCLLPLPDSMNTTKCLVITGVQDYESESTPRLGGTYTHTFHQISLEMISNCLVLNAGYTYEMMTLLARVKFKPIPPHFKPATMT